VEQLSIVIPSHRRAEHVRTLGAVTDPIVCVAEDQEAEYREHNPAVEIVVHPATVIGLPAKRQWIYEYFGSCFMLDDDVPYLVDLMRFTKDATPVKVDPAKARALIERCADTARQVGAYLFGFNNALRPDHYQAQDPLSFTGYIPGHSTGILAGSKLYWNAKLRTTDDYWMSALNAYQHRIVVKDLRYCAFQVGTFASSGGQASHRTMAQERESTRILQEHFGEAIKPKRATAGRKATHSEQRMLKLPY